MFFTIYKHELKNWFKKPEFFTYVAIFLSISILMSAANAGIFDELTTSSGGNRIVNSPISIYNGFGGLAQLILFLIPSIIGVTIFRDYKSEMHSVLYSYPFTKKDYLAAKFFSGLTIVVIITLMVGLGMIIGFRLPGTNAQLVGGFQPMAYINTYLVYILPNVILFGAIVFAVVTFTRNITAGFIAVIIIMLLQGLLASMFSEEQYRYVAALLDPYGSSAQAFYTKYWTVSERNELQLPFKELIIYNRLIWLAISSIITAVVFKKFSFSQNALKISFRKKKAERVTKSNFGGIIRIKLPKVTQNFSFLTNLKNSFKLSSADFKYVVTDLPFIAIALVGLIIILLIFAQTGMTFGSKSLPVTRRMLSMGIGGFTMTLNIITFLYSGMLIHRARMVNANHLIDSTPTPNWVIWMSKLIALVKVQFLLLFVVMLAGVIFQLYSGYYNFEFGLYAFHLFVITFLHLFVWALLSFFVQTLVKSPYLGLFILLVLSIGIPMLSLIGVEQSIFKYNQGTSVQYSDMNGYGSSLSKYLLYKAYWILLGLVFLTLSGLFWVRGLPSSFKERLTIFKNRLDAKTIGLIAVLLIGFCGLGAKIYYENNVVNQYTSKKESEENAVTWEKKYKKYQGKAQPRIVSVNVHMNIFPKTRDFKSSGTYKMINKTSESIDSLFLNHNGLPSTFKFNKRTDLVVEDTILNFDIYRLKQPLKPGDALELSFTVENKPNTMIRNNSSVLANGTFLNSGLFPSFGYSDGMELKDDKVRKKYDLPKNELKPYPSDTTALGNTYISGDSDWVDFEATVSTDEDQIAIAPGYLQKEWVKGGRKYFHYKMDSKILNFYAFNSGKYEVKRDKWNGVNIEIYYHKGHDRNIDRMIAGVKASLDYNSKNFSPYQHRQVRIIEFPKTYGSFAQSFANTIPFSETIGFIADVDVKRDDGFDYPFAVTVHELAHQWWAHQVIGADVMGATMLSESLSEYVSLKVLEKQQGKPQMRKFLKKSLDSYLRSRAFEKKRETPLMYNDGQQYVHYQKGSLVFYAMSDYIGEDKLNGALKKYVEKVKFQSAPYTTSEEMVDEIRKVVPDSLKYTVKDMFETVTLYRNRALSAKATKLDNGKYKVDIEFNVSKYRNDEQGKEYYDIQKKDSIIYKAENVKLPVVSVPLADYIDIGVFGQKDVDGESKETELYLKKHKVTKIHNKITLYVDEKPIEVGVDPYNKLIDTKSSDNRMIVKKK